MKIIDAHMHYFNIPFFQEVAAKAGYDHTAAAWQQIMQENQISAAIAMGNVALDAQEDSPGPLVINLAHPFEAPYNQPDNIYCCLGIHSDHLTEANAPKVAQQIERLLQASNHFVGIKLYMGYSQVYINDKRHWPLFEVAQAYNIPIAMHSGETASGMGILKYAHPLTVDEAAANFPKASFVICHMGNPWLADAVTVAGRHERVYLDLSGLVEGCLPASDRQRLTEYFQHLLMWLKYLNRWDKLMYGSDWPIVNIAAYIRLWQELIPEEYQQSFFYDNALRIYHRLSLNK